MRRRWQKGTLKKIGGKWIARWWEDCIAPDGSPSRRLRYANLGKTTKEVAKEKLGELVGKENIGRELPRPLLTFQDFVHQRWAPAEMPLLEPLTLKLNRDEARRQALDSEHRPASADTIGSKIRNHLMPFFGSKPLGEITPYEVELFRTEKAKQGYSRSHVKGMCAALSKILQAAVAYRILEQNPARGLKFKKQIHVRRRPVVILTASQLKRLTDALPEPCRSVVLVAVLTGLRIGEILGLRWSSLDLEHGMLTVDAALCERVQLLGPTKTPKSTRKVPISESLRQVLEAYRQGSAGSVFVFSTPLGTPLSAKNLRNRMLDPVRKNLNLPKFSWHDLRHTFTTAADQVRVTGKVKCEILGHSSVSLSENVYTHASADEKRSAMESVAEQLQLNVVERKPQQVQTVRRGLVN